MRGPHTHLFSFTDYDLGLILGSLSRNTATSPEDISNLISKIRLEYEKQKEEIKRYNERILEAPEIKSTELGLDLLTEAMKKEKLEDELVYSDPEI